MTFLCIPHLILAGLMGIYGEVITVSKVSVEAGGSISIPCLYEQHYTNHVKYLCKGNFWLLCNEVIYTDEIKPGRFSISDDVDKRIFTVTINDLKITDNKFWCAVKIENGVDVKKSFKLSVTTGMSGISINRQEITGFEGGSVTATCHYKNTEVPKWCRLGSICATAQAGSIDGTTVHINTSVPNVFDVMMSELSPESSGWYFCASGDFQMPVHVTVNKLTLTTVTPSIPGMLPTTDQNTSFLTSPEPYAAEPTNSTISGTGGESLQDENMSFTIKVTIIAITLVSQLFIIPAAFFGLRMIIRKKSKEECDTTMVSQVDDPNVLYATLAHNQHGHHGQAQTTQDCMPPEDVTYSTIAMKKNVQETTEPADGRIHSLTSVSKVQVKAGDSISIPCLYSMQYVNLVKYLCEGYYWRYCKYVTQTDQPQNSGKFSISDDKQGIFTVTIRQLTNRNSYFWCSFQYPGGSYERTFFELSITGGTPSLYVDNQKATGFIGENVAISCHSTSREIAWCRIGGKCVTSPSGSIDGTAVNINKTGHDVFTVTMSELRQQDSGWYWCKSGDLQMPVHVTVTEKPTTFSTIPFKDITTPGEIGRHSTNSFDLKMLIIPLGLLILIVSLTFLVWFMLKRKHAKAESSSATTKADEEVAYCNVTHRRKSSVQMSPVKSDVDILYASVVAKKNRIVERHNEANATDVTYSTLAAPQHRHI
ncbi:polymeric immunoglobulin receptor-like [Mugil cephalus]|uniref:polymeric immunoglobulin receptor-like n=1 Tax=Mugil cephalus TaxID=48193 RepID=UPI001FB6A8FD|nr:polymeric immunoglobulin receptor-like [Mugil cephalus]